MMVLNALMDSNREIYKYMMVLYALMDSNREALKNDGKQEIKMVLFERWTVIGKKEKGF
jgi:hypothetical protein